MSAKGKSMRAKPVILFFYCIFLECLALKNAMSTPPYIRTVSKAERLTLTE